jgi:hypothetical protein
MIEINSEFYAKETIKKISRIYKGNQLWYFVVKINLGDGDLIEEKILSKDEFSDSLAKLRNELIAKLSQ